MNDSSLSLLIKAMLDSKSTESILSQIEQIQAKINANPLNFRINIDSKQFNELSASLQKIGSNMSQALNVGNNSGIDKFTSKMSGATAESRKLTQEITESTNQLGQTVKIIDDIDKETKTVIKSTEIVTNNYKKQREEAEKLNAQLLKNKIDSSNSLYNQKQAEIDKAHTEALRMNAVYDQQSSQFLKNKIDSSNSLYNQKIKEVEAAHTEALQINKNLEAQKLNTKELQNQIALFQKKMQLQAQSITGKYGSLVDSNSLNHLNSQINSLSTSTPDVANKMKTFSLGMKEIETNAKTSGKALNLAQQDAKSFGKELLADVQKFSLWFGIGTMFMSVVHAIKNAISTVKLLDDSLLELNKVTSITNQEMDAFVGRAYKAGEVLARTGKEVIDATTVFAKAGFELEEAFNLGKEALLLTNIADGITNVEDAASSLIAVLRGYNMEASETAHIVDLLNEVSNKYAVDTDNLTDGLQRASGTLAMTGTSVEQLTGMLTGGYEALRNMEKVSSGLITISQRLRGVSESGEEIDGLMPKLQKAFKEYAGIDIQTQNGKLRSTFDILSDLQGVWSTLNEEQKQYIGELASGVRQAPVLNAIIQNWKSVEGATESAINSLGSAEKENAKYLDSISGRVAKFSSSVQLMWSNTIDSDVIKFFVDLGTGIIKIVDSVGLLNTVLFATVTYFTFFKTSMLLAPIINLATAAITKLTIGLNLSTAAAITLNTVLGMLAPIAIATGIMAIVAGIKYLSEATERQREVVRKLKEEYDSFSTSLEENESKQQKVIDRLQELYDLRNANKITTVEKEELTRLENVNTELQRQIEYEKALKAVKGEALERETLKLSNKKTLNYNTRNNIGYVQLTVPDEIQNGIIDVKEYTTAIDELKTSYDNNEISAEDYGKKLEELEVLRSTQVAGISELITKLEEENKNYVGATEEGNKKKAANEVIIKSAKDFIVALSGEENALNALGIATSDGNKETQSYTQSLEEFNKSIDTAQSSLKDLNQILEDNGSLTSDQVLDLLETYPELLDKISKTTDGYKIQESALEDLRKQQIATALDSINSQITEAENVKTQTENKLKSYGLEIEKLKDIASAKAALAKLAQQEALNYANASSGAETNEMLREKRYSSAYKSSLASSGYAELSEYEQTVKDLEDLSKKKSIYEELLNDKGLGLSDKDSGGKEYTASTEQQALSDLLAANKISYEEYLKRLLALEKSQYSDYANKSASQLEDMLRSKNEKTAKRTEEYLSLTTEISSTKNTILENTLSSLSDEYDNGKISIDKYISSLEQLRKQGGLTAEQLKNINDTIEDLSKTQQEAIQKSNDDALSLYEDVNSQITDLLKKKYELEADAEEKAYNDRKDKLDKSLDDYKDYIDGILDELDRVNATEDYNAKVSESSTKINTIDAEINKYSAAALSGDLEAINKIAELQKEKDEEVKSLKEIQTDRERDLVKQTYQDNLDSYEKYVDGQQDLNDTAYDKFKDDLALKTTDTALAMEAQNLLAQQNIGEVQNSIIDLFTLTGENATIAGQLIQSQLIAKLQQAMDIQKNMNMISGGSSGNNPLGFSKSDFQTYLSNKKEAESGSATPDRLAQLRKENEELRKKYGVKGDLYSYAQLAGYYKDGGINTTTGFAMLHGTPTKPEYILNTTQMQNLVKNLAFNPVMTPKINLPSFAGNSGMGSVNIGDIKIFTQSVDNNSIPKLAREVASVFKNELYRSGQRR